MFTNTIQHEENRIHFEISSSFIFEQHAANPGVGLPGSL